MSKDKRERERFDNMLMRAGGEYGEAVTGLRFVVPPEADSEGNGDRVKTPGVYFSAQHPNSSPTMRLRYEERRLTRDEALAWAEHVDQMTRGRTGSGGGDGYPRSHVEFVAMWYEALSRRLGAAIEATEKRRVALREVHAALTGGLWEEEGS